MKKRSQIWVDPKFKTKLKKEAVEKGLTLMDFSSILAERKDDLLEFYDKTNKKKNKSIWKL